MSRDASIRRGQADQTKPRFDYLSVSYCIVHTKPLSLYQESADPATASKLRGQGAPDSIFNRHWAGQYEGNLYAADPAHIYLSSPLLGLDSVPSVSATCHAFRISALLVLSLPVKLELEPSRPAPSAASKAHVLPRWTLKPGNWVHDTCHIQGRLILSWRYADARRLLTVSHDTFLPQTPSYFFHPLFFILHNGDSPFHLLLFLLIAVFLLFIHIETFNRRRRVRSAL